MLNLSKEITIKIDNEVLNSITGRVIYACFQFFRFQYARSEHHQQMPMVYGMADTNEC